uniref:Isovaleryl CoA dehydrogenase n=1 Tax=mine drainage metagenome TaxID=410659 RepID=E6PEW7_9ZZZZ
MVTHTVFNQVPPLEEYDLFSTDRALTDALHTLAPHAELEDARALGRLAGTAEWIERGRLANDFPPELHAFTARGERIDEVRYHPAWHDLMRVAVERGLHAAAWADPRPHPQLRRAVGFYLWSQVEAGHVCPISMTAAAIPAIRHQPELAAYWEPHITARSYDPRLAPFAEKSSALCGMAMTEKQGGSDVRANTTLATPQRRSGGGEPYTLVGHKWFCSAPMCDLFFVLAQAPGGLTCFLVPRILPDGTRNGFAIQRLKSKLGNRSNASAEIEFDGTQAWAVGEEGRGVATIAAMINQTRLDCALGSAALMRQALAQAIHHARHRMSFGKALVEHPSMSNVLADLALESEAATLLALRLADLADAATGDGHAAVLKRIGTGIGKFWVCKRAVAHVGEAIEALGGNGYVEESMMPRLYREVPVNSVWEGSGNINALDILRVLRKEPESIEALRAEYDPIRDDARVRDALTLVDRYLSATPEEIEGSVRVLVERLGLLWQAALMRRHSPHDIADAFIETRFGERSSIFGAISAKIPFGRIVERAAPVS